MTLGKLGYFVRSLRRRGPAALRRRLEVRRSKARLAALPQTAAGQIVVGISVGGVLGDSIIVARFLRDLAQFCDAFVFDVYSGNVAQSRWIFENVAAIRDHFQDSIFDSQTSNYDFTLFFSDTVCIKSINPDRRAALPEKVVAMLERIAEFGRPGLPRVLAEGLLSQEMAFKHNQTRPTASHFMAGIAYGGPVYDIAVEPDIFLQGAGLAGAGKKYITVHNGFAVSQVTVSKTSTKSYLQFGEAIASFRATRPDILFVQIGSITSVSIAGVDLNLIGKTNLKQAAGLIKGAVAHLDNEGGFVHLASCFGVPACVVYGPTSPEYYAYEGHVAIRPLQCGGCWWLDEDFASRCPRGMADPVCIRSQPPAAVAAGLVELLGLHGL